jgi:hypothetical protein
LIRYIFKRWGNYIYIHTQKNHVDLKYVSLQVFYEKKEKKNSKYRCCSSVWNSEDSNVFLVKSVDILI